MFSSLTGLRALYCHLYCICGLRDSILVHTKDAILVLHKEKSQDVKKIYNTLERHQSRLID